MSRIFVRQPFRTLRALQSHFNRTLPAPYDWRLFPEPCVGQIHGIPTMRGVLLATNGILCAIEAQDDLMFGHLAFFIPDDQRLEVVVTLKAVAVKKKQSRVNIGEFI